MAEDWREKYLNLLDQQEREQAQRAQLDNALKHGLSRVSLFSEGLSADIDRNLEKMRELVRGKDNDGALVELLERLANNLARFEATKASELATPYQVVLSLVDQIDWPNEQKGAVKELRKVIDEHRYAESLPVALHHFAKLCVTCFYGEQETHDEPKRGLFAKWFGGSKAPTKEMASSVAMPQVERLTYRVLESIIRSLRSRDHSERLLAALSECQNENDVLALTSELIKHYEDVLATSASDPTPLLPSANELFITLLDKISLPDELEGEAKSIKNRLATTLTKEQWPAVMEKISDLIASLRRKAQQEKQDIERFLSSLTDSLKELDDRVQGANHAQEYHHESGQVLNAAVQAEMSGLESSVQQAADLNVLKHIVQDRIEQIRKHMESYQVEEEERFRAAVERMRILNERLHHLEQESDKLRARVREQRNQALRDTLTGINNRLAYDERIEAEFNRWKRFRGAVSLVVWDVDHFKKINDTFGHQAGDRVLIAIAKLLSSQVRESDFLARYGGEEFVLIAPGASRDEAFGLAEKLRAKVAASQFKHGEVAVPVTISCGIVEFKDGYTLDQLFEAADQALYQAKLQGRNMCVCAELG